MTDAINTAAPRAMANVIFFRPTRPVGGAMGQTVEATSRAPICQITAWEAESLFTVADALDEARAENARLRTLLARTLVFERDSAEDAFEVLGGSGEAIALVEAHHAALAQKGGE